MLDVRRLRLLRAFSDRGSIAATAKALGYTPSAVSQLLAVLEREVGLGELDHPQDPVGVVGQPPAGVGQFGAARGAVEQRGADLALEDGELLGDGRRRVAERLRRRRDASPVGEFAEQTQSSYVEHKFSGR